MAQEDDERIRKALIKYLDALDDDEIRYGVSFKDMRVWLEKQEQKPTNTDNKFIRMRETKPKDISEFLDRLTTVEQEFLWEHIAKIRELDKEEQKSADNIESSAQNKPWSEEDEEILKDIITDVKFEGYNNDMQANSYKKINWLKSLRPQSQWKPSEGQLECLGYAIEKAEKDWLPLTNNRIYLTLKALKEQLKKLKG